jgi:hypothetical protein
VLKYCNQLYTIRFREIGDVRAGIALAMHVLHERPLLRPYGWPFELFLKSRGISPVSLHWFVSHPTLYRSHCTILSRFL